MRPTLPFTLLPTRLLLFVNQSGDFIREYALIGSYEDPDINCEQISVIWDALSHRS
jgi:hypothetical protein